MHSGDSSQDAIDIRDLALPVQTAIIYVQTVYVELLLTRADTGAKNSHSLAKRGIFIEKDTECNAQEASSQACIPLVVGALQSFFSFDEPAKSKYVRPRLFVATRLSDLAPGVFVPEFSRAVHARQKLVPALTKVLTDFMFSNGADSAGLPSDNQPFSSEDREDRIWSCMINTLRQHRKLTQHVEGNCLSRMMHSSEDDMLESSNNMASTSVPLQTLKAIHESGSPAGLHDMSNQSRNSIHRSPNLLFTESGSENVSTDFGGDTDFYDLFEMENSVPAHSQQEDEELLLVSPAFKVDIAADSVLLNAIPDFLACKQDRDDYDLIETSDHMYQSQSVTQQSIFPDTGIRWKDSSDQHDHRTLIGQDLLTHDISYADVPLSNNVLNGCDYPLISDERPLFSLPRISTSIQIDRYDCRNPRPGSITVCSPSESTRAIDITSDPFFDSLDMDDMKTQPRRESITNYKGRWSMSKSKTLPIESHRGSKQTITSPNTLKHEDISLNQSKRHSSDYMLFDSFDFTRSPSQSPPENSSNGSPYYFPEQYDNTIFNSPYRSATEPSSAKPSPAANPRKRVSLLKRLSTGSESLSMSEDDILFQQVSPVRDVEIKGRKSLKDYSSN